MPVEIRCQAHDLTVAGDNARHADADSDQHRLGIGVPHHRPDQVGYRVDRGLRVVAGRRRTGRVRIAPARRGQPGRPSGRTPAHRPPTHTRLGGGDADRRPSSGRSTAGIRRLLRGEPQRFQLVRRDPRWCCGSGPSGSSATSTRDLARQMQVPEQRAQVVPAHVLLIGPDAHAGVRRVPCSAQARRRPPSAGDRVHARREQQHATGDQEVDVRRLIEQAEAVGDRRDHHTADDRVAARAPCRRRDWYRR